MKNDDDKDSLREAEKEILRQRPFDLADAIGRRGAGTLKGASPIPRTRRLLMDIDEVLEIRLPDPEGSLRAVILQELDGATALLEAHLDDPQGALATWTTQVLDSPSSLDELVRKADAHWGRQYGEKPHFNREGQPDHPDDPYTPESVKAALAALLPDSNI